jgi:uncharacterized protein (TIGR03437 family)
MTAKPSLLVLCLTLAAASAIAQPSLSLVVNGASNALPGLPNAPIAKGAIFVGYGAAMGPATLVKAEAYPLQTALAGTSIQVNVSGTSVAAIPVYTSATQIAGILPSRTPAGTGTITVTYNGQTSRTLPITVVESNVGLVSLNSKGTGEAVATLADYSVIGPSNAPTPGEVVVFWATGVGPISEDETKAPAGGNLANVPLEVFIGGKPAQVLYRGRAACCAGTDQINVVVPEGISGCLAPVAMKVNNLVSNSVTIPVAQNGRQCTPTNSSVSTSDYQRALARGSFTTGGVSLTRTTTITNLNIPGVPSLPGVNGTTTLDTTAASFVRVSGNLAAAFNAQVEVPTVGSCVVYVFSGQSLDLSAGLGLQGLDAGSISVSGPKGSKQLTKSTAGGFVAYFDNVTGGGYLDQGTYTATGTGGPGIGAFTAQQPMVPELNWTNQASLSTVDRASGITFNWTGGDPAGLVYISGNSYIVQGTGAVGASFQCIARAATRSFTVPPSVLLALPASGTINAGGVSIPQAGTLAIAAPAFVSAPITATGLDFGYFSSQSAIAATATYR